MATQSKVELIISAKDEFSQATNKFTGSLTGAVVAGTLLTQAVNIGTKAIGGFVDGIIDFNKKGLSMAAQLETNRQGFVSILGSSKKADEAIRRIKKDAASTPFEIPGLIVANQQLTAITKDADRSERFILNIGKALAFMGKGQPELDRISVNLQQIGASGRATMIDIKQFAFAGIPIFEMLQQETGLTGDAFDKFVSDGNVSFKMLEDMFNSAGEGAGKFSRAFIDQAGTFNQLMSNMNDSINIFSSDFVKAIGLFDLSKEVMKGFVDFLAGFSEGFMEGMTSKLPDIKAQWGDLMVQIDRVAEVLGITLPKDSAAASTSLQLAGQKAGELAGKSTGGGIAGLLNLVEEFMKSLSKKDIQNFKETLSDTKIVVKGLADFMINLDEKTEGAVSAFRDIKKTAGDVLKIFKVMADLSPTSIIGNFLGSVASGKGPGGKQGGGAHGGIATIPAFATGGVVGGVRTSGDNMVARLNSEEAVLPKDKFNKLMAMIDSGSMGGGVTFNVNVPLFMGDAQAKRSVAEEIFKEIERIAIAKGVSLNKLSLLGT